MKKKALLFVSFAAMLLSAALLITPAGASITSHCTTCTAAIGGSTITANCQIRPRDACVCPLSGQIVSNNCLFLGATKPQ